MDYSEDIQGRFSIFAGGTGGIDSWITPGQDPTIIESLKDIERTPLTQSRLNQLLTLAHEAPISEAMFKYYWLSTPSEHPYDVCSTPKYRAEWVGSKDISSLDQLYWGMYRFYIDSLLFFGSIRTAYQTLRTLNNDDLRGFFANHAFDAEGLRNRGPALPLNRIPKDDRYLISEMACKSYEIGGQGEAEITEALLKMYKDFKTKTAPGQRVSVRQLLDGDYAKQSYKELQGQFQLAADDILDEHVQSEDELRDKVEKVAAKFKSSHDLALKNTTKYLSMVGDLDVYVATSMRNRADFRSMADFCEKLSEDSRLSGLNLRYFDPTLSAASHHEDKGLIECLMVKCAKALVLYAGSRDSFGKDAEAAMALSLGKPVIIYCSEQERQRFFRDVHPLSRLIHFDTGVAVGAMVTHEEKDVSELLSRIFTNKIQYSIEQRTKGYLILKEQLTNSVVRLQTSDNLLRETFWNYYHGLGRQLT